MMGLIAGSQRQLHVHPVGDPGGQGTWKLVAGDGLRPQGVVEGAGPHRPLTPAEAEYLSRYLPPDQQAPGSPGRRQELERLRWKAVRTNDVYAALVLGWVALAFVGVMFLTAGVHSAWVADYVVRSGRGPLARVGCYLELYPPTLAVVMGALAAGGIGFVVVPPAGGWPWVAILGVLACVAAGVVLAHVGVIRRWHPLRRVGTYVGLAALAGLWVWVIGML
jgi:hypothetical protein